MDLTVILGSEKSIWKSKVSLLKIEGKLVTTTVVVMLVVMVIMELNGR